MSGDRNILTSHSSILAPQNIPRLFVGNFDFEHWLAYGNGTLPESVERINRTLMPVWAAIASEGDAVWTHDSGELISFDWLADLGLPVLRAVSDPRTCAGSHRLVFWGENEWARVAATRWGFDWSGCEPPIVRRVNSRRFKSALERRLGVELPGSAIAESESDLRGAVERLEGRRNLVLKGEFGGAGREVRFGTGSLTAADFAWAANRWRRGLAVMIEPRLDSIEEAGLQFWINRDREVAFDGVTPLLSRPGGGYLGNRFQDDPRLLSIWQDAIAVGRQVAEAVATEGYFGPLGIDAMRYRGSDGTVRVRAIQDLNARYTMGRLALGLRRFPKFAAMCCGVFRPSDLLSLDADQP